MLRRPTHWLQAIPLTLLFCAVTVAIPAFSTESSTWHVVNTEMASTGVQLKSPVARPIVAGPPFFVVTHGMGGTCAGDRFHRLAETIRTSCPTANVLLVDWSDASRARTAIFGLPNPFPVANRIDQVADDAAEMLFTLGFTPQNATLIGESFGNCVNARIAKQFGGVERIIAMNPASEFAGYPPPNLSACARLSWSFHTYSVFDTLQPIAHASIFLETRVGASEVDRHTSGIRRLTHQLERGDRSWLLAEMELQGTSDTTFNTVATLDGRFVDAQLPRVRPTKPTETLAYAE